MDLGVEYLISTDQKYSHTWAGISLKKDIYQEMMSGVCGWNNIWCIQPAGC